MSKKNISVIAKFSSDGKVTPQKILWDDGRSFDIDRVSDIRKSASLKGGGIGMRYGCYVRGKLVFLFKDEDSWFMEF